LSAAAAATRPTQSQASHGVAGGPAASSARSRSRDQAHWPSLTFPQQTKTLPGVPTPLHRTMKLPGKLGA
jgi:hypothetical protein